jgi:hypothetical protein
MQINRQTIVLTFGAIVVLAIAVSWCATMPQIPSATTTSNISSGGTVGWKTLVNSQYGFALDYPNYYSDFKETMLASNLTGIYLQKATEGGFRINYKNRVSALASESAGSIDNQVDQIRINVYDLNSYGLSDVHSATEFTFDSSTNQWWQDTGESKSVAPLPKISVGNNLTGYEILIGDAGEGFQYVLIPIINKKIIVEIMFYKGIGGSQNVPIDTILSTFRSI